MGASSGMGASSQGTDGMSVTTPLDVGNAQQGSVEASFDEQELTPEVAGTQTVK